MLEYSDFSPHGSEMQGYRTQSADEVQGKEFLAAYSALHQSAEHVQGEHVEENMREPSVHEHVGDELPPVEEAGSRVEEREVAHHEIRANLSRYKDYYVDNEQVLGYRCGAEPASSAAEVLH